MAEFEAAEEFILTVTANGYGKRTSAYEYRRTNRGGQGITNIELERNGPVVASFPAHNGEQLMLVTDQAKLIRTTVGDIRIAGRNTQGVTLFRVADGEHVVSAARIDEEEEPENEAEAMIAERAHRGRTRSSSTTAPARRRSAEDDGTGGPRDARRRRTHALRRNDRGRIIQLRAPATGHDSPGPHHRRRPRRLRSRLAAGRGRAEGAPVEMRGGET
jgi:hypothetical protein